MEGKGMGLHKQLFKKVFIFAGLLVAAGIMAGTVNNNDVDATTAGFEAGNIMSDEIMSNNSSMTESQIDTWLHQHGNCNDRQTWKANDYPELKYHIKDGHFVCLADETFHGQSAAHVIKKVADQYRINPQVLIVLLQKEQGLITDSWPNSRQYQIATGFGCPDTGSCDSQYYGLENQLKKAASLFRTVLDGGWSNYPAYRTMHIGYNPSYSCGSAEVYIANKATSALYRYTPYVPNQAALNAGYGSGNRCSSYGNRNFYNYFTDWFGSTRYRYTIKGGILSQFNKVGGLTSMGQPQMKEHCKLVKGGCWQAFDKGTIYWTKATGAHVVRYGDIRNRWGQLSYENGALGYPTGDEHNLKENGKWQSFENGSAMYSSKSGTWENYGQIRNAYAKQNYENGSLGYPTSSQNCGLKDNGCYQRYQGGSIYYGSKTGGAKIYGTIFNKWASTNYENGVLGYPTSYEEISSKDNSRYRTFENGDIYWVNKGKNGTYYTYGAIADKYDELGRGDSWLGYPTIDQKCGIKNGGCWQNFQNGNSTIYYSSKTGTHILQGSIHKLWNETGYERGSLGYPTSDEIPVKGGVKQTFEYGTVYWINHKGYIANSRIATKYDSYGGTSGYLGRPVTSAKCGIKNGGCWQTYENGRIYYSNSSNAQVLWGGILSAWQRNGYEHGRLGYPTSDEIKDLSTGGVKQTFEHGTIQWYGGRAHVSYK